MVTVSDHFTYVLCPEFSGRLDDVFIFSNTEMFGDVWRKSYTMCGEILVPLNFKASRAVDPVFRQRPPTLCDFPCVQ